MKPKKDDTPGRAVCGKAKVPVTVFHISTSPANYMASRITSMAEQLNASVLALCAEPADDERMHVRLTTTEINVSTFVRELFRFGYDVDRVESDSPTTDLDVLKSRVNEVLHYLDI